VHNVANSWLTLKLAERGMAPAQVAVCENILVEKEGLTTKASLATVPPEFFTLGYLRGVGVAALGTASQLVAFHKELHAQCTAAPSPTPSTSSAADTTTLTPIEKARLLEIQNTLQSLTAELQKLRAATAAPSKQQQQQSGGGGEGKGGLMLKQTQCNVVNLCTKQPYKMDELVAEIHSLSSRGRAAPKTSQASPPQRGRAWSCGPRQLVRVGDVIGSVAGCKLALRAGEF
jgi:hypothetical protein